VTIGHYLMIEGILGLLALVALVVWIARGRRRRVDRARARADEPLGADVDHDELEAAERDVRDLGSAADPDDDAPGDDWGPGTYRGPRR
jgi:hypothetical protein